MSEEKRQLIKDILATVALGFLAYYAMRNNYPVVAAIGTTGITIVNTLTIAQLIEAIQLIKERELESQNENPEP